MKKRKPKIVNIGKAWDEYSKTLCGCEVCQALALFHFIAGATAFQFALENLIACEVGDDPSEAININSFMIRQAKDIGALAEELVGKFMPSTAH